MALNALKLDPGNAGIMDTLGYALLKNNRRDDAKKVLEQAVKLLPNNPTVCYHLALAYRDNGEKPKAVQTLQKSLTLGDFPEAGAARTLLTELKK
jgi:Flp pilus assembly protein TadD